MLFIPAKDHDLLKIPSRKNIQCKVLLREACLEIFCLKAVGVLKYNIFYKYFYPEGVLRCLTEGRQLQCQICIFGGYRNTEWQKEKKI